MPYLIALFKSADQNCYRETKFISMNSLVKQKNLEAVSNEAEESREERRNLKDLAQNIVAAYDARVKIVGEIIEDTRQTMSDFKKKRNDMSGELQKVLAKCESLRKKDFDQMMANIVVTQNKREEQVKKMLEDFRKEEEMVAEKLKSLLKKGEKIRIKDFKKMMLDIKQEQERRVAETGGSIAEQIQEMQKEVHIMLDNFKKERQSVASAWNETICLLHREKIEDQLTPMNIGTEDVLAKNKKYGEEATEGN